MFILKNYILFMRGYGEYDGNKMRFYDHEKNIPDNRPMFQN